MSGSNIKDNKVVLKEDVLVFATGTKIITGVDAATSQIRDMQVNPGDIVVTNDGTFNIMGDSGFVDPTTGGGGGGLDPDLLRVYELTGVEQVTDNSALNIAYDGSNSYAITTAWTTPDSQGSQNVSLSTGQTEGATSNSGQILIATGNVNTSGDTGSIAVETGVTTEGSSGAVSLSTGNVDNGNAGHITLQTGGSNVSDAGNIYLNTGMGGFVKGTVFITAEHLEVNTTRLHLPLLQNSDWSISGNVITFISGATENDVVHVAYNDGARKAETLVVDNASSVTLSTTPTATSYVIVHKF